jgi:hypothetical protein
MAWRRPLFELIKQSALVNPIKKAQQQRCGRAFAGSLSLRVAFCLCSSNSRRKTMLAPLRNLLRLRGRGDPVRPAASSEVAGTGGAKALHARMGRTGSRVGRGGEIIRHCSSGAAQARICDSMFTRQWGMRNKFLNAAHSGSGGMKSARLVPVPWFSPSCRKRSQTGPTGRFRLNSQARSRPLDRRQRRAALLWHGKSLWCRHSLASASQMITGCHARSSGSREF